MEVTKVQYYTLIGEWKKLHSEDLQNLFPSVMLRQLNKRWDRQNMEHAWGETENEYNILEGRCQGKKSFGRPKHIWG
jgi:hypothetical protein